MGNNLRLGLIGLGHLGKIHFKCLQDTSFEVAGVYDIDNELKKEFALANGIKAYATEEALLEDVDAVDIVSTTSTHYEWAKKALLAGKHVFVEKPVTASIAEAKELLELYKNNNLKFQIGHVERFNPALLSLKSRRLAPKFIEGHRLANFNPRGNDVSVVLDLMIHDLDIVLALVGSPVKQIHASGVAILSETPDICNARIEFENGCVANLTASRISLKQMRKLRIFQEDAYISIDFLNKEANLVKLHDFAEVDNKAAENWVTIETKNGTKLIEIEIPEVEPVNSIQLELESFYEAIRSDTPEKVTLQEAFEALKLAHEIVSRL